MRTNLQIIQEHYAASDRKDIAAMMADVAPDVRWTEAAGFPCAGTHVGPQQIIDKVFKVLGGEWEGYTFKLDSLIDGGATIAGVGTYSGTYRKTGKAMQARVVHVWQLDGGKIRAFEQFTDTLLVARAMT
ncbi:MAG: nuclear transport factor 2 family protein [Burkholderiaceae bacterium]|nr:nuclear transport factor 2 family protein [Burkholderiaceae bacterium]